jgi:hypothetical protein
MRLNACSKAIGLRTATSLSSSGRSPRLPIRPGKDDNLLRHTVSSGCGKTSRRSRSDGKPREVKRAKRGSSGSVQSPSYEGERFKRKRTRLDQPATVRSRRQALTARSLCVSRHSPDCCPSAIVMQRQERAHSGHCRRVPRTDQIDPEPLYEIGSTNGQ